MYTSIRACGIAGLLLLMLAPLTLQAATIPLDTALAPWMASGGGAVNAVPYQIAVNLYGTALSITSDSYATGTFLSGGSLSLFGGFWTASLDFFLPADASNVSLSYSGLAADDRVVLELNGVVIGSAGLHGPGAGQMTFTEGGPNDPFTFDANRSSGTVTSGFTLGGNNTLQVIVNNTFSGISGTLHPLAGTDGTYFGILSGAVTYAAAVPEPASATLILLGAAALFVLRRRLAR